MPEGLTFKVRYVFTYSVDVWLTMNCSALILILKILNSNIILITEILDTPLHFIPNSSISLTLPYSEPWFRGGHLAREEWEGEKHSPCLECGFFCFHRL